MVSSVTAEGAVRVGRRTFEVREFSTGYGDKADAQTVGDS
jgi:hypothetical protein